MEENKMGKCFKLIERTENGDLRLLEDNLLAILERFKKVPENEPLAVVSCVGSPISGKSLFSNVVLEYVKKEGRSWTDNGTVPVMGFPFNNGNLDNKDGDGVYVWGDLLPLTQTTGENIHVWMLHAFSSSVNNENATDIDRLQCFVTMASSFVFNILIKDEPTMVAMSYHCNGTEEDKMSCMKEKIHFVERRLIDQKDKKLVEIQGKPIPAYTLSSESELSAGATGVIAFTPKQMRELERVLKILKETKCKKKRYDGPKTLTVKNIPEFVNYYVGLVQAMTNTPNPGLGNSENSESILEQSVREAEALTEKDCKVPLEEQEALKSTLGTHELPTEVFGSSLMTKKHKEEEEESWRQQILARFGWAMYENFLQNWINLSLTKETIANLGNLENEIRENCWKGAIERLASTGLNEDTANQIFKITMGNEYTTKFQAKITSLETALTRFCCEIENQLDDGPLFQDTDFQNTLKGIVERISGSIDPSITDLFEFGATKLRPYYLNIHKNLCQQKQDILEEMRHQLRDCYRSEMTAYLSGHPRSHPNTLANVHESLTNSLLLVFKDATCSSSRITEEAKLLKNQLLQDFQKFERENITVIKFALQNLNREIGRYKSQYEDEMGVILESNPDGLQPSKYESDSQLIKYDVVSKFMPELDPDIREKYLATLMEHLNKSEIDFLEENSEAWNTQRENTGKLAETTGSTEVPAQMESNLTGMRPLILHIGPKSIDVASGMEESMHVEEQPFVIGRTTCGKWLCGKQLGKLNSENSQIYELWELGKLLKSSTARNSLESTVNLCNSSLQLCIEFLIAIYLRSLGKFSSETELRLIVILPSWYSSFQRQIIVDAAQIAGFMSDSVHIFNEEFLSVYNLYYADLCKSPDKTFLLFENSGVVNVSGYKLHEKKNYPVNIINFYETCKNLEATNMDFGERWWKVFGGILYRAFTKFVIGNKGEDSLRHNLKGMVKCTKEKSEEKSYNRSSGCSNYVVLVKGESDRYKTILEDVANDVFAGNGLVLSENHNAIHGALNLYQDCLEKGRHMKNVRISAPHCFPFHVNAYDPFNCKQDSKETGGVNNFVFLFPTKGSYQVEERNKFPCNEAFPVGSVNFKHIEYSHWTSKISLKLARSNQGILAFKSFQWLHGRSEDVCKDNYEWVSANMSDTSKGMYMSLIDKVEYYGDEKDRAEKLKKHVLLMANALMAAIDNGDGDLINSIVRSLVLNEIKEIVEFVDSEDFTMDGLEKKSLFLENVSIKYKLSHVLQKI